MHNHLLLSLTLLASACASAPLPPSEQHDQEWRGRRTFQSFGDLYLASDGNEARRVAERMEDLEEVIRKAAGASATLEELLLQPGLIIVMGLDDELFGENGAEHMLELQGLMGAGSAPGEGPLGGSSFTPMSTDGKPLELTEELQTLIARAMSAPVALDLNNLDLPDSLTESSSWCCIVPDPRVEDALRSKMIAGQIAKLPFAKRAAFRAMLPLVGSKIRRGFRRANYQLQAMARLRAADFDPDALLELQQAIRELPLDTFSDPD